MTRVLACDLSLTATGVALPDGTTLTLKTKLAPTGNPGMARLAWMRDQVLESLWSWPDESSGCVAVDIVVIEGYSYGSGRAGGTTHAHGLGELGGVVRLALYESGIPTVDIPPACLKMYATGKGNAGKADVLVAAVKRLGYDGSDNNQSDALWLREMALDHYDGIVNVPESHRRALTKIDWPDMGTVTE